MPSLCHGSRPVSVASLLFVMIGAACGTTDEPGKQGGDASDGDGGVLQLADAGADGSPRGRDAAADAPWMSGDAFAEPEAATREGPDASAAADGSPGDAGSSGLQQYPSGYASTPGDGLPTTSGGGAARPDVAMKTQSCPRLPTNTRSTTPRAWARRCPRAF